MRTRVYPEGHLPRINKKIIKGTNRRSDKKPQDKSLFCGIYRSAGRIQGFCDDFFGKKNVHKLNSLNFPTKS